MFRDDINRGIRHSASLALRHAPALRGRWQLAGVLHKCFPPLSPSSSITWARMRLGYEMKVDLRSNTEFRTYYLGDFDTEEIRSALRLIGEESIVLDVGANIGFWSVPLASHLKGRGRLHCFEPVPSNFGRLAENIRKNNLDNMACLHQSGLSDHNGPAQISLWTELGAETGNAAIIANGERFGFSQSVGIMVNRLDDIFDSLHIERVDFIKADIEGHEDRLLAGASETIKRFRPILYVEINQPYYQRRGLDAPTIFEEWLKQNSYCGALRTRSGWRLDTLRNCKVLDNAFFFPSEVAGACIRRITS